MDVVRRAFDRFVDVFVSLDVAFVEVALTLAFFTTADLVRFCLTGLSASSTFFFFFFGGLASAAVAAADVVDFFRFTGDFALAGEAPGDGEAGGGDIELTCSIGSSV